MPSRHGTLMDEVNGPGMSFGQLKFKMHINIEIDYTSTKILEIRVIMTQCPRYLLK
jgi:hypothetical protein